MRVKHDMIQINVTVVHLGIHPLHVPGLLGRVNPGKETALITPPRQREGTVSRQPRIPSRLHGMHASCRKVTSGTRSVPQRSSAFVGLGREEVIIRVQAASEQLQRRRRTNASGMTPSMTATLTSREIFPP